MQNREDIHECEDERDAERMREQTNTVRGPIAFNAKLAKTGGRIAEVVVSMEAMPIKTKILRMRYSESVPTYFYSQELFVFSFSGC